MTRLLPLAVLSLLVLMLLGCQTSPAPASLPQGQSFPERKFEFEIQGLVWRTIAYYYHPGIYEEIYDDASNTRLLSKARSVGANYLLVRAFYSGTRDGNLVGNTEEAERYLRRAIATAHAQGFKIFLAPFVESMEFWPERKWRLSAEEWTDIVLHWAQFACLTSAIDLHASYAVVTPKPCSFPYPLAMQAGGSGGVYIMAWGHPPPLSDSYSWSPENARVLSSKHNLILHR